MPSWKKKISFGLGALLLSATMAAQAAPSTEFKVAKTIPSPYPTSLPAGEVTRFSIALTNGHTDGQPITDVSFTDTFPAGVVLVAASAECKQGNNAAVPLAVGGSLNDTAFSVSGVTIPGRADGLDGECVFNLDVTARTAMENVENSIGANTVSGTHTSGAVTNAVGSSQTVTFTAPKPPSVSKSFSPSTVSNTQTSILKLTVTNPSTIRPLEVTSLKDSLPAGLSVASPLDITSTCTTGGTPLATTGLAVGQTVVTLGAGRVAAGGNCSVSFRVKADIDNLGLTSTLTNTIAPADLASDSLLTPTGGSANLKVDTPFVVSKSFSPTNVAANQPATLTVTLKNNASEELTLGALTDFIDGGTAQSAANMSINLVTPGAGCSLNGLAGSDNQLSFNSGTLAAGSTCTLTVNYTPKLATDVEQKAFTNTIGQSGIPARRPSDDPVVHAKTDSTVTVRNSFTASKQGSTTSVAPGGLIKYTMTLNNWRTTSEVLSVTDTLDTRLSLYSAAGYEPAVTGTGCSLADSSFAAPNANFKVNMPAANTNAAVCTLTFWTQVDKNADLTTPIKNKVLANQICLQGDSSICAHSDTNEHSFAVVAPLSVSKSFDAASKPEGEPATVTLTLSNYADKPLTNVSLKDVLPTGTTGAQLELASPVQQSSTCGGSISFTTEAGAPVVNLTGASVPARQGPGTGNAGSCTLKFRVLGELGTYNNTVAAADVTGTQNLWDGSTQPVVAQQDASANVAFTAVLSGSKSFAPNKVSDGGRSTLTLRLTNAKDAALTGVAVTDNLPAGMVVASPANAYSTCDGAVSLNAAPGASVVGLSGARIAAKSNCALVVDVIANGSGPWLNTVPGKQLTADGGVVGSQDFSRQLDGQGSGSGIAITAQHAKGTLSAPGATTRLKLTFTNNSGEPVTDMSLDAFFRAAGLSTGELTGERIAAFPNVVTTCTGAVVEAPADSTGFSFSGASLPAGATCELELNVTMDKSDSVQFTVPVGGISTAQGVGNGSAAQTGLSAGSSLGLSKEFSPTVVAPGQSSRLKITLLNPTDQPVRDLALVDNFPAGMVMAATPRLVNTCAGTVTLTPTATNPGKLELSGGTLPAGSSNAPATCSIEVDVQVVSEGEYVNSLPAGSLTGKTDEGDVNNPEPGEGTLVVKHPVEIHKAFDNQTLDTGVSGDFGMSTGTLTRAAGTPFDLTIALKNPNTIALTGVTLVDQLPDGLTVAPTPNVRNTCAATVSAPASGRLLSITNGTLAANSLCKVTVSVLSNSVGSYVNDIGRGSLSSSEGVSNDVPTSAQVVITTPPGISKQFEPPMIKSGDTSRLTIRIDNPNAAAFTLTSALVDTLPTVPGPVTVANPANIGGSCHTGSNITANPGAGTVTLANGTSVAAGGCTIEVDVTATAAGVHTNEIPRGALQTSIGNNPDPATATLTVSNLGYISGRVFVDNDGDGRFGSGDSPLPGSTISLHAGNSCAAPLVSFSNGERNPQQSGAGGDYLFTELPAGIYSVCQNGQPAGTLNALPTPGAQGGGQSENPAGGGSQITSITLTDTSGDVSSSANNDFPEVKPGSISGSVFLDLDNNGLRDGSDSGLSGVTIQLVEIDASGNEVPGGVSKEVTTNSNGDYRFDDLPPGRYKVIEPTQPTGTSNGKTTAGSLGGTASDVTEPISNIADIVLGSGQQSTGNNFAEQTSNRTITGKVFLDLNDNEAVDSGEKGIGGQTITLSGTDNNGNPVSDTAITDSAGNFTFTGLPPGNYSLTQSNGQPLGTLPGGTVAGSAGGTPSDRTVANSVISGIDLTTEEFSLDNLFAEIPVPDLVIAKTHEPENFLAASTGEYIITVGNIGQGNTDGSEITVLDDLPAGLTPKAVQGPTGWNCSITGQRVSCTTSNVIPANTALATSSIKFIIAVEIDGGLGDTQRTNVATIEGGGEQDPEKGNNRAEDPTDISRALASIEGNVWFDSDHDRVFKNSGGQSGWIVELLDRNGVLVDEVITNADGSYRFSDVTPDRGYEIRFRHPQTGTIFGRPVPNESANDYDQNVASPSNPGGADTSGGTLKGITVVAGSNITQQSLPLDPAGVIYDAVSREPVGGAEVTISGPSGFTASDVLGGSLSQMTGDDGFYQFLLLNSAPAGTYSLMINAPAGYRPGESVLIPVCDATLSVGATPDPALVQSSDQAPVEGTPSHENDPAACSSSSAGLTGGAGTTQYYFSFYFDGNSANLVNNHIPLDPVLGGAIIMTKSTPKVNVVRGEMVPYVLTATNTLAHRLLEVAVEDQIPPGFKYVKGSSQIDSLPNEPVVNGRHLKWSNLTLNPGQKLTFKMLLVVGTGVGYNEYVNQTWAINEVANSRISNVATATVRVVADPTFECSDLIGTVYDDKNRNGYQDKGEPGLPGVRVATPKGWLVTTDNHGRYHIACADVPNEMRGGNFIVKVDERTLPSGYRVVTENPRVVRLSQGRLVKANFGASIHRVVRLDLTPDAFDGKELKPGYQEQMGTVMQALHAEPSILRIAYRLPVGEKPKEARERIKSVTKWVKKNWEPQECCYDLQLEEEIVPAIDSVEVVR